VFVIIVVINQIDIDLNPPFGGVCWDIKLLQTLALFSFICAIFKSLFSFCLLCPGQC